MSSAVNAESFGGSPWSSCSGDHKRRTAASSTLGWASPTSPIATLVLNTGVGSLTSVALVAEFEQTVAMRFITKPSTNDWTGWDPDDGGGREYYAAPGHEQCADPAAGRPRSSLRGPPRQASRRLSRARHPRARTGDGRWTTCSPLPIQSCRCKRRSESGYSSTWADIARQCLFFSPSRPLPSVQWRVWSAWLLLTSA